MRIPLLAPVWTVLLLGWISGSNNLKPCGQIAVLNLGKTDILLWTALAGFSLVVAAIYICNQIADIESDRINHKLFLLPRKIVTVPEAWAIAVICAAAGMAISFTLPQKAFPVLFASSLLLGYLYNFPPARLKDRAWGGTIANFLGHGVITFLVGWLASDSAKAGFAGLAMPAIASLSAGFANAAVYITTTIPDAEGDRKTGKKTFCVAYGERVTAVMSAVFCFLALLFAFTMQFNKWLMILPSAFSSAIFLFLVISPKKENAFKAFKWPVFLLSAGVSLYVPEYAILILVTFFGSKLYYRARFNLDYPTFKSR
jgi:4-hydroxybenzoate polyprenyltransferase